MALIGSVVLHGCTAQANVSVVVTNNSGARCGSDIMALLTPGRRMWFLSDTGYGGDRGHWEPVPRDGIEGVGVIDYPPGERTWPMVLPALAPGTHTFELPIRCGDTSVTAIGRFTVDGE